MNKKINRDAAVQRMQQLADIKHTSKLHEATNNLGTLVDYERGADKVAYGIVKENHHYFIKKSNTQKEPNVSDFAYIGGLGNITEYQYNTLSEAEKHRNMILLDLNEAYSRNMLHKTKINESADDKKIKEDAEENIKKSEDDATKLDVAMEKEKSEPAPEVDITEPAPEGGEENIDIPEPAPEGGEEDVDIKDKPESDDTDDIDITSVLNGGDEEGEDKEDVNVSDTEEPVGDGENEEKNKEISKEVGKVANLVGKTEMNNAQIKSYFNSLLAAFKEKFPSLEIEDRKKMANEILNVVPAEDIESINVDDEVNEEDKTCNECGFAKYVSERGYDADSIMECTDDEMANLISGYAVDKEGDIDDDDVEQISVFTNKDIQETLNSEYGQSELSEKLGLFNESEEDELNELKDNNAKLEKVKGMFWWDIDPKKTKQPEIEEGFDGNDPANVDVQPPVTEDDDDLDDITTEVPDNDDDLDVSQHEEPELNMSPGFEDMGSTSLKPDGAPVMDVDINAQDKTVSISMNEIKKKFLKNIAETVNGYLSEVNEAKKPSAGLSKKEKSDVVKKAKKGEDIGKKGKNFEKIADKAAKEYGSKEAGEKVAGSVMWKNLGKKNEELSESEQKLRKYIRARLEEKAGLRKPVLNENSKSDTVKKLDQMIDKQFSLFESIMNEKWNTKAKIKKTDEYAGKTIAELKKELANVKKESKTYQDKGEKVPERIKKKEHQINFAIRAKKDWPKK